MRSRTRTSLGGLVFFAVLASASPAWPQSVRDVSPAEGQQAGVASRRDNPLAGDRAAIAGGSELYAGLCAACHGKDARGAEGPDLYRSRVVLLGSPRSLFDLLRGGIPGTEMLPFRLPDEQTWQLVSYLHSLTRPGMGPPIAGDPEAGRQVFEQAGCMRCHQIGGKGRALGPDLSSIALRSSPDRIRRSILEPGAEIAEGHQTVRVVTKQGQRITGALKNEDNFSLQIMRPDGQFAMLLRSEVTSAVIEPGSLMPEGYGAKLTPEQLQNLLAFLDRQRAPFVKYTATFQNY